MKTLLCFFLLTTVCFADDFVRFDPATGTYLNCQNYGNTNIPLTNPNDLTATRPGFLYANPLCANVLPSVPDRYRKVVAGIVVEMSQAEKDAVDAPGLAEAARQLTFTNEVTMNNVCTAELSEIDARVDALIDPIANLSDAKAAMKIVMKKIAKCVRARAR